MIKTNEKLTGRRRTFSDSDWLQRLYKGSNKTMFQNLQTPSFRAIQGHTCGNVIVRELMGHVAIPCKWKKCLFYRGCSCVPLILESELIA